MINRGNYEIWFVDYLEGELSPEQTSILHQFLCRHPDLERELREMGDTYSVSPPMETPDWRSLHQPLSAASVEDQLIALLEGDLTVEEQIEVERKIRQYPALYTRFQTLVSTRLNGGVDALMGRVAPSSLYRAAPSMEEIDDIILSAMDGTITAEDREWLDHHLSEEEIRDRIDTIERTYLIPDSAISYPDKGKLKKRRRRATLWWGGGGGLRIAAALFLLVGMGVGLRVWLRTDLVFPDRDVPRAIASPSSAAMSAIRSSRPERGAKDAGRMASVPPKDPAYHSHRPVVPVRSSNTSEPTVSRRIASEGMVYEESGNVTPTVVGLSNRQELLVEVAPLAPQELHRISFDTPKMIAFLPPNVLDRGDASVFALEVPVTLPIALEVPKSYTTIIKSFVHTGLTYLKGREENKAVIAFDLGPFSFYHSNGL